MKIGRYAIEPPQGSTPRDCPSTSAHAMGRKPEAGAGVNHWRCPTDGAACTGTFAQRSEGGIRSSARYGRRCGAACPVLVLLRRADPAERRARPGHPRGRRGRVGAGGATAGAGQCPPCGAPSRAVIQPTTSSMILARSGSCIRSWKAPS